MQTYFSFTSFEFSPEKKKIVFNYESGFDDREPLMFSEEVLLPADREFSSLPKEFLDDLLHDVHLILGISYYKLYCPPEIRVPYRLSKEQAEFWSTAYRKGLGEFAYRNGLDLRGRIRFPSVEGAIKRPIELPRQDRALAGIGGGKDSAVAVEWLKEASCPVDGFIVETYTEHDIAQKVCEIAGIGSLVIRRTLDQKLFQELPDSYKGHIPISAVYAFLGVLAAALYDYRYVVVGNEWSSNFGNVEHFGEEVNHQWSKSHEFEQLLMRYLRENRTPDITYFSIARPFYEIRIAEAFTRYPKYFSYITGCNRKFRIDASARPKGMWCCECSKCAFIFLILAPWMERNALVKMFGRDMLDDRGLIPLFADILGFGSLKPFDCVGTFEEAQAALYLANEFKNTAVAREFLPRIADGEALARGVMRAQQALTVSTLFRFSGMKSALILGYGKEGRVSETYLKHEHPNLELGVADESLGADYLEAQERYDMAVKTPGIPKEKVSAQYLTATNLFFSKFRGITVGVTGSKGKSTTAALIDAILLEAGLPARLAGNIGTPMLELLSEDNSEKAVAVLELSSYQLDDIEFSPHIAVVTNLFPEHMDYHGTVEKYYDAKKNIIRFQKSSDSLIFNPNVPQLAQWAKEVLGKAIRFVETLPFPESSVLLLGKHNLDNVRAAAAVASLFNIPPETIEKAVRNFKGLPHRLEFVGEFQGIRFYDDAISTTPESTIAALEAVPNVGTIFLGGFDRGYDFTALEKEIRGRDFKNIVLFPESGKRMFAERSGLNILETSSMKEAVAFAYKNTKKGDAVLLSCASPSYGLWKNFEEKGDSFQTLVRGR